jgi:hypothetical protein
MNTAADPVVAVVPVLGVETGHVAEARRALLAQGRDVDDDAVTRLLWAARAMPAVLDVLAIAGALDAVLQAPSIEIASSCGGMLAAIARCEDGNVIVEIVEQRALFAADDDRAAPACVVTIPFARAASADDGDIAVHRFTIGPPG